MGLSLKCIVTYERINTIQFDFSLTVNFGKGTQKRDPFLLYWTSCADYSFPYNHYGDLFPQLFTLVFSLQMPRE